MSSIKDLINKSKGTKPNEHFKQALSESEKLNEIKPIIEPKVFTGISKPKPFKLGTGMATTKPVSPDEKPKNSLFNIKRNNSPASELADTLQDISSDSQDSISNILGDLSTETPPTSQISNAETGEASSIQQNSSRSPTLDDLSKFVFDEQPDNSTEEIALKFSSMLNSLGTAVGSDIPTVLSDTLKFMKEHAFLAEILKPEEIGKLVQTMARSYGFVATSQNQKSEKKKKKSQEQNLILNSLDMLKF